MDHVKPKLFKILDQQDDEQVIKRALKEAKEKRANIDQPEVAKRFLKHYNRARLALASTSKALKGWETIEPKSEPQDQDLFANWLNSLAFKAVASTNKIILDFKRPLTVHMMLIPKKFL